MPTMEELEEQIDKLLLRVKSLEQRLTAVESKTARIKDDCLEKDGSEITEKSTREQTSKHFWR